MTVRLDLSPADRTRCPAVFETDTLVCGQTHRSSDHNEAEIIPRVEKDTYSALVIAAQVLVGVPSHVGLAVAEATPIRGNQSCFDLA